jgi:hypothetical protein
LTLYRLIRLCVCGIGDALVGQVCGMSILAEYRAYKYSAVTVHSVRENIRIRGTRTVRDKIRI